MSIIEKAPGFSHISTEVLLQQQSNQESQDEFARREELASDRSIARHVGEQLLLGAEISIEQQGRINENKSALAQVARVAGNVSENIARLSDESSRYNFRYVNSGSPISASVSIDGLSVNVGAISHLREEEAHKLQGRMWIKTVNREVVGAVQKLDVHRYGAHGVLTSNTDTKRELVYSEDGSPVQVRTTRQISDKNGKSKQVTLSDNPEYVEKLQNHIASNVAQINNARIEEAYAVIRAAN